MMVTKRQLESQIAALKRVGRLLSAERDTFCWDLIDLEEKAEQLIPVVVKLREENARLEAELHKCRDFRHKLLLKLRDEKAKASKFTEALANLSSSASVADRGTKEEGE